MVIVDSSVWIDFFQERSTEQTIKLDLLLASQEAIIGDLVATEVLQGFRNDSSFNRVVGFFGVIGLYPILNSEVSIQAARNYRHLRAKGTTPRGTIDALIATRCILDNIPLLTSDRDFDAFGEHLGLVLV
jgi:predicted nucleic acid-binding protein